MMTAHEYANAESPQSRPQTPDAIAGVLIGTAVGDALGLPMEGLTAERQRKLFPSPLRHRLHGSRGMISDDTEHTLMVAQSLIEFPDDPIAFQRSLAWKLRWWLASLPAGVGFATLRAIIKLWLGFPPRRSGVMSAGNGPAMRSALLGVYFAGDAARRREFVRASTEITHRDPRAGIAALAVAETAAWMAGQGDNEEELMPHLECLSQLPEWVAIIAKLKAALSRNEPAADFARELGVRGRVSGYAFQSVPVAIYAALRHRDDFESALSDVIACGGDTDTVGAITGALVGARAGVNGVPAQWRDNLIDWPRSIALMHRVGTKLRLQMNEPAIRERVGYFWPAIPFRNLIFLAVVLAHGFRRLFPLY